MLRGGRRRPLQAHRDNGPGATAHWRFAVSINLNGDFDGGEVTFPEYNPRGIKAPPGWAVVFSAAILHAVGEVAYGRRYAFLPFVYDAAGAKIREDHLRAAEAQRALAGLPNDAGHPFSLSAGRSTSHHDRAAQARMRAQDRPATSAKFVPSNSRDVTRFWIG